MKPTGFAFCQFFFFFFFYPGHGQGHCKWYKMEEVYGAYMPGRLQVMSDFKAFAMQDSWVEVQLPTSWLVGW